MMGDRVLAPPQNARFALDGNNVICSSPALNPTDTSIISSDTGQYIECSFDSSNVEYIFLNLM